MNTTLFALTLALLLPSKAAAQYIDSSIIAGYAVVGATYISVQYAKDQRPDKACEAAEHALYLSQQVPAMAADAVAFRRQMCGQ